MSDWMDDDSAAVREQQKVAAVEFAKNYLVFVHDSRGAALLEHWERTLGRRRTPVNAQVQEYAANEALRAFVQGIREQIEMAQQNV